jgi:DDE superfamily endonuclease
MWSSSWRHRSHRATSWCSTILAAHRVDGIRQALAAVGASLFYLPPYSPDLNPIEQLFAKLKVLLRRAAARTRDESLGHHRPPAQRLPARRMRQLSPPLRLWVHLTRKCSSPARVEATPGLSGARWMIEAVAGPAPPRLRKRLPGSSKCGKLSP